MSATGGGGTGAGGRVLPFRVYLISDRRRMGADPPAAVAVLAEAGLRAFQWREKDLPPGENLSALRAIEARLAGAGFPPGPGAAAGFRLFVNDRADLALATGADLHLTEASIPTADARRLLPPGRLLARSTHDAETALRAAGDGADLVTFGPIYATASKRGSGPPAGLDALREVCRRCPVPVAALGGIDAETAPACLDAGAAAVAVIGAVWSAPRPVEALRRLLAAAT